MSRNRAELREVEQSPDGRYVRFDEKLGSGAYKEVYLSYDTETGKEVAWNTVEMRRLPAAEKRRIRSETEILAELQLPHIINFYHVWESKEKEQICFTTEIVTSGTLKEYTNRVRGIKLKVIKKWCRQILTALDYLHSHDPPIIHRDLKCDNIFINGGTGEIRLGDFGLSAHRTCTHVASVLGTPEFMAPELYEESYSEGVDIYAFGMCVLEMCSKEYPYEECSNAAQIWKKVTSGHKPDVLARVHDRQVRSFIELCISPERDRLSATELLQHPFLAYRKSDNSVRDNIIVTVEPKSKPSSGHNSRNNSGTRDHVVAPQPNRNPANAHGKNSQIGGNYPNPSPSPPLQPHHLSHLPNGNRPIQWDINTPNNAALYDAHTSPPSALTSIARSGTYNNAPTPTTGVSAIMVDVESVVGAIANIVLHIHLDGGKRKKQIKFAYDFRHDTSRSLAGEMVASLKLPDGERTQALIEQAMDAKISPIAKGYQQQQLLQAQGSPNFHHVASPTADTDEQALMDQIMSQANHTGAANPSPQQQQAFFSSSPNAAAFTQTTFSATSLPPTPNQQQRGSIFQGGVGTPLQPTRQPSIGNAAALTGAGAQKPPVGAPVNNPRGSPSPSSNATPNPAQRTLSTPTVAADMPSRTTTPGAQPAVNMNNANGTASRPTTAPPQVKANPSLSPQAGPVPLVGRNPSMPIQGVSGSAHSTPTMASATLTAAQVASLGLNNGGGRSPPVNGQSHKHSHSLPFQGAPDFSLGAGLGAAEVPAPHPPHSPPYGATTLPPNTAQPSAAVGAKDSHGQPQGLDEFESNASYEEYLKTFFCALSNGQLKDRLKTKPGGAELVRALFEKKEFVAELVRISVQEQVDRGVIAGSNMGAAHSRQQSHVPAGGHTVPAGMSNPNSTANSSTVTSSVNSPNPYTAPQPDFFSPDILLAPSTTSHTHGPIPSPDPFQGLGLDAGNDVHPREMDAPLTDPFHGSGHVTKHAVADHRFAQQNHSENKTHQHATNPATAPVNDTRKAPTSPVGNSIMTQANAETPANAHGKHLNHPHLQNLTPTSLTKSFPFSPAGPFSNHSETSSTSSHFSHTNSLNRVVSDEGTTFDFQVSVTSPVSTPDVGLDGDFLSQPPPSAPTGQSHSQHSVHSNGPLSAPGPSNGITKRGSMESVDLLSDASPTTASASAAISAASTASKSTPERVRLAPSLGGVLEELNDLDVHPHVTPHPDRLEINRIQSGTHRLTTHDSNPGSGAPSSHHHHHKKESIVDSTVDLLSSPSPLDTSNSSDANDDATHSNSSLEDGTSALNGVSNGHSSKSVNSTRSDSELDSFFGTAPKNSTPSSHGDSHHEKQKAAIAANKTVPLNFNLADMFGSVPSDKGTKPQRSHTTAEDSFDPLFFPSLGSHAPKEPSHAHASSVSIPMNSSNATNVFAALGKETVKNMAAAAAAAAATKQQRTKSEADQAEAAIMQNAFHI